MASLPALLDRKRERRGERGIQIKTALFSPTLSSLCEEERENSSVHRRFYSLIQWQWGSRVRGHASSTRCENPCTGSGCLSLLVGFCHRPDARVNRRVGGRALLHIPKDLFGFHRIGPGDQDHIVQFDPRQAGIFHGGITLAGLEESLKRGRASLLGVAQLGFKLIGQSG